jgi:predicted RNA-binding Zn-ribbon protein involved in translation (DUF1610 family)
MDLVDSKYIGLVSSRLPKFKRVKANLYNFRCPICGDSQKHKNKARGYLYPVKTNTNYKCHNCGASMSFNNFLKEIDPALQKQYAMEKFKEGHAGGRNFVVEEPKFTFTKPEFSTKLDLPKCSEVEQGRIYLEKRKLDPSKFYYAEKYVEFVNSHKKTFDTNVKEHPRIIIPLYYEKELIGVQGRSVLPNSVISRLFFIMTHQKSTDWITSEEMLQSSLQKAHSTQRSFSIALLCAVQTVMLGSGVLALLFGFMITSRGLRKLQQESPTPSTEVIMSSSGQIK